MNKKWIPILGYEQSYEVSNSGNVKSIPRKWTSKDIRFLTPRITKGYETVALGSGHGKFKSYLIHRLVAIAFIPNPENKKQVNHKDGNKRNNNVLNLEWCTNQENCIHASNNGFSPRGESSYRAKLKECDVVKIRQMMNEPRKKIAIMFGICPQTVSQIIYKKIWRHV